jgi:hypothetical protein
MRKILGKLIAEKPGVEETEFDCNRRSETCGPETRVTPKRGLLIWLAVVDLIG